MALAHPSGHDIQPNRKPLHYTAENESIKISNNNNNNNDDIHPNLVGTPSC